MPKEEWGVKRVCPKCSVRFYDLQRDPMTCPSCAHSFTLESLNSGISRTLVADKSAAKAKAAPAEELEDEAVLDDGDVDLDDDVLDDEDDDNVSLDDIADVSSDDEEN
ncbi:TIGR02300 family protein [Actibacterium sp. MT2.3-13A]|uniref:TIGR02300 family protein n=1 Tax=Actibacterium sp. MT2.3-13A TaxID=2828332 RepID=UPI001BA795F7|nr:TIGR02300 family protein [Actibacterium sp. MT2.3-13A]